MKRHQSISPTMVIHDTLLLTTPRLDASAVAWIPAGTRFQPLTLQHGFLSVAYQQHQGFLPIALCTPWADQAATPLRFPYASQTYSTITLDQSMRFTIIPAGTRILRLGQHHTWTLIQGADGRCGFVSTDDIWNNEPSGCIISGLWYLAGCGWLMVNWIGMVQLSTVVLGALSGWTVLLNAFIAVIIPIVFLRQARTNFTLVFSIGALTISVIGGALSIILARA